MLNIYDSEREPIMKVGIVLQDKWNDLVTKVDRNNLSSKRNSELMTAWADEARNRYRELGYVVEVDITPALADVATPTISFVDRVTKEEFDFDKMAYEVKKSA